MAARFAASGMGGNPTLNARYFIPSWEDQIPVLGGQYSHRSFDTGRFAGKARDLRQSRGPPRPARLRRPRRGHPARRSLDAGRVFEREKFKSTRG